MTQQYDWLKYELAPKVIAEAMKLYGTKEVVGSGDNPAILEWAKELGMKQYNHDSIAWCGLFMAIVIKRAGYEPVKEPLWARNWTGFGANRSVAMLGDVLVFTRESGGHVGFYVGEDNECYHVLGGNQSDQVRVSRIQKSRCIGIRRCVWKVAQPASVRVIILSANGEVSKNEA